MAGEMGPGCARHPLQKHPVYTDLWREKLAEEDWQSGKGHGPCAHHPRRCSGIELHTSGADQTLPTKALIHASQSLFDGQHAKLAGAITDSFDIAKWADDHSALPAAAKLFPPGKLEDIKRCAAHHDNEEGRYANAHSVV